MSALLVDYAALAGVVVGVVVVTLFVALERWRVLAERRRMRRMRTELEARAIAHKEGQRARDSR